MLTLHALLVGINACPQPVPALRGCLDDVQRLHACLESYCQTFGIEYRPVILTEQEGLTNLDTLPMLK